MSITHELIIEGAPVLVSMWEMHGELLVVVVLRYRVVLRHRHEVRLGHGHYSDVRVTYCRTRETAETVRTAGLCHGATGNHWVRGPPVVSRQFGGRISQRMGRVRRMLYEKGTAPARGPFLFRFHPRFCRSASSKGFAAVRAAARRRERRLNGFCCVWSPVRAAAPNPGKSLFASEPDGAAAKRSGEYCPQALSCHAASCAARVAKRVRFATLPSRSMVLTLFFMDWVE